MNTIVLENTENGDVPIDVYHKLASDRVLFINDEINDRNACDIVATLLLKDGESDEKITLFLNSEEGDIRSIFMIYDVIKTLNSPIEMICSGSAFGEILLLLSAGTPGMRYATKNSIICGSHLIYDRVHFSDLTNIEIIKNEIKFNNKKMLEEIAKNCKKTYAQINKDFKNKKFMTATQAKKYGLIDAIVKSK